MNANYIKEVSRGQENKISVTEKDMEDDMISFIFEEFEKNKSFANTSNQDIAQKLKESFDNKYYPTWMCIVGKSFGCRINAQAKHYICFKFQNKTIILYKYH